MTVLTAHDARRISPRAMAKHASVATTGLVTGRQQGIQLKRLSTSVTDRTAHESPAARLPVASGISPAPER